MAGCNHEPNCVLQQLQTHPFAATLRQSWCRVTLNRIADAIANNKNPSTFMRGAMWFIEWTTPANQDQATELAELQRILGAWQKNTEPIIETARQWSEKILAWATQTETP